MGECSCTDIELVQSTEMSTNPDDFFGRIVIEGFYIAVGDTIVPLSGNIPFELTCAAVIEIESANFCTDP